MLRDELKRLARAGCQPADIEELCGDDRFEDCMEDCTKRIEKRRRK
jgi:phytoene/squalene synthetase